jgi:hypothetical protein
MSPINPRPTHLFIPARSPLPTQRPKKKPWLPTKASSVSHPQASQLQIFATTHALRPSHDHGSMTRSNPRPISSRPQRRQPTVRARAPEPQMSLLPPARFPARLSRRRSAARSTCSLSEYVTCRPDGLNACRLAGGACEISEQRLVSCFPAGPVHAALPIGQPCPRVRLRPQTPLRWSGLAFPVACCCWHSAAVDLRT